MLLSIDTLRLAADRNRVHVALVAAQAQLARARAERDGASEFVIPDDLAAAARVAEVEDDIDQQRAEFANRMQRHVGGTCRARPAGQRGERRRSRAC